MDFGTFLSDVFATMLGGAFLAFLFFLLKERVCALPDITGQWTVVMTTHHSSLRTYQGMTLTYIAMVWRDGSQIAGTVEKVFEKSVKGSNEFVGIHRTRGVLTGSIQKNYLSRDRVFVHIVEDGHGRESTHFFDLEAKKERGQMVFSGQFRSMVANQAGTVAWER